MVAIGLVSCAACFLLPNDCHVVSQCDCSVTSRNGGDMAPWVGVFCESRHFARVPTFQNVSYKMSQPWTIDLQLNSITGLPDNAFSNLQAYGNNNNVSVLLGHNNLRNENISDSAFSGLENLVVALSLYSNQLTSIPPFVTRLTHLRALNIQYNPITYIDPSVFISIRGTLKTLKIGTLRFSYSTSRHPVQIPSVVCELNQLEFLDVKIGLAHAQRLSGDSMIDCTMNTTTKLIWTSSYYKFPDVFKSFPNIEYIGVKGYEIQYIDDSLIPTGSRVKTLNLFSQKLQTIPGAIKLFSLLEYFELEYNEIETVERRSFDNLHHLKVISLQGNPLIYISRFAFHHLVALQTLNLGGTKITTIPHAVVSLPNLYSLDLGHNIICTCKPWMKRWSLSVSTKLLYVFGDCLASNETLHDFVFNTLPNCP